MAWLPDVEDAKRHLAIGATLTADQEADLEEALATAILMIERRTGPLTPKAFTQTVHSRRGSVLLDKRPVISIDSVTALTGSAPSAGDLWADPVTGVVSGRDGSGVVGDFTLTYTAGRSDVPDNIRRAVLRTVRHLWNVQRGNTRRPTDDDSMQSTSGSGYALPWAAIEMLGSDDLVQGTA